MFIIEMILCTVGEQAYFCHSSIRRRRKKKQEKKKFSFFKDKHIWLLIVFFFSLKDLIEVIIIRIKNRYKGSILKSSMRWFILPPFDAMKIKINIFSHYQRVWVSLSVKSTETRWWCTETNNSCRLTHCLYTNRIEQDWRVSVRNLKKMIRRRIQAVTITTYLTYHFFLIYTQSEELSKCIISHATVNKNKKVRQQLDPIGYIYIYIYTRITSLSFSMFRKRITVSNITINSFFFLPIGERVF
jgi:hypothetical protein